MEAIKLKRQWRQVKLTDIVTLIQNVQMGAKLKDIGFEDARRTVDMLTNHLARQKVSIELSALESALWSCNMMAETKRFQDPWGRPFDLFLKDVLGNERFDKRYNFVKTEDDNE